MTDKTPNDVQPIRGSVKYLESKNTLDTSADFSFVEKSKVCIAHSKIHGRGVFAVEDIVSGELIERCPLIPMENRSKYHTDGAVWRYCYPKPYCECSECKNHGFLFFMVLGNGMIYNHQDNNNAEWSFDYKKLYSDVVATRDIKKGEEIFVNYGEKYFINSEKVLIKNDSQ